jgi:hypothetical protein
MLRGEREAMKLEARPEGQLWRTPRSAQAAACDWDRLA